MAWYDSYFEEIYYLLEEPNESEIATQVDFIRSFLEPESDILELGCGSGKLSLALARLNHRVTGLEYIETLVKDANRASKEAGLNTEFVKGDMRSLPYDEKFHCVISFSHSLGYFYDHENFKVVAEAYKALKPGGRFLLDLASWDSIVHEFERLRKWWMKKKNTFIMFRRDLDPLTGRVDSHIHLAGEKIYPSEYSSSVRYYTFPEMERMLQDAGFRILEVYGSYEKTPFTLTSPRMIIISGKPSRGNGLL